MNLTVETLSEGALARRDYMAAIDFTIESSGNKLHLSFQDGEPEDNSLGRNFEDVFSITEALKMAFEAGRRGESINVKHIEVD